MAVPTIVQAKYTLQTSSSATITVNHASDLTAGNYLYVACWGHLTMATASISDGANTFTPLGADGYANVWMRHWYAPIGTGGDRTITVTPAANRSMTIVAIEVSGVNSGTPVDTGVYNGGQGTSWQLWDSTSFPASPLNFVATANADSLVIGVVSSEPALTNVRDFGANTGWTQHSEDISGPSVTTIYKNAPTTGTYDPDFTLASGGGTQMIFAGVAFVGASGGGSGKPDYYYRQLRGY